MKLKTHLLLSMALACLNLFGATYYWNGGTITNLSSWPSTKGGSTFASNFTTSADIWDLNLASSANVDISGWSMNGTLINSASSKIATLTTASGNFTSTHVGSVWVVPTADLVVSGINVVHSSAGSTIPGLTYTNLTLSNSTGIMTAAGPITVSASLTTTLGGTLEMGGFQLTFNGTGTTLTNGGTITTIANNAFVDSRTTKTFGGTVIYNRAQGARNVSIGSYDNLTINNTSGTYSVNGPISVSGTLTTAGGIFSFGSSVLTLSQSTTILTNNGTILTYDAFVDSRTTKTYGGTIVYNRPLGGKKIGSGSYTNLTITNSSGTYTADGAIVVSGTLTTSAGGTLAMDGNTLTLGSSSTLVNNGIISTTATTPFTDNRIAKTFDGNIIYSLLSGGQTIASGNYSTLTLSNTSGINIGSGALSVSVALILANSAGIFDVGSNNTLTVARFVGPGHIKGGTTSNIDYTGTTASFLYMDSTTEGTTNRLNSLTLNPSAILNLGNTLYIHGNTSNTSGDLVLGSSSTLTSNTLGSSAARLKLKLSSSNTPAIIALNGGSIAGEIYYEDYLNSGYRGYRQWGHCLDSAGMSLNQITDDINLYADITSGNGGRGVSGNINGLLASTGSAKNSIFTYDETLYDIAPRPSRWVPYKINGSTVLYATKGKGLHMVLRPTGTGESGSYDAQVIDYEGQPNTTADVSVSVNQSATLANPGWNLLSNPYPSYLNWASFVSDNAASLKSADQALTKYDKATKNYKATTKSGANWYNSLGVSLGTAPNIDPGDAFFTQIATGISTLTFKRTQTTATRQNDIDRTNKLEIDTSTYSTLYIKMRSVSDSTIGDEATVISGSWGGGMKYGAGDALNLGGTCMDLSIISIDDQKLAFKTVSNKSSCLIPLYMTSCTQGDYTFDFSINANIPGAESKYELVDNYKKTKKQLKDGDRVSFQITGDSISFGSGRFYLNAIANTTGVENVNKSEQSWLVYPNPVNADGEINIANPKGLATSVTIVNALGGLEYAQEIKATDLGTKINLSALHLSTGIYYIHLLNSNHKITERLMIRNN